MVRVHASPPFYFRIVDNFLQCSGMNELKEIEYKCVVCDQKVVALKGTHPTCPDAFCGANCRPVVKKEEKGE